MKSRGSESCKNKGKNRILLRSFLILWLAASCILSGCVRVAGTTGYWHTGEEGEAQVKQAGFDTASLVPKGTDQGNITF